MTFDSDILFYLFLFLPIFEIGYRMPIPEGAPQEIYRLMLKCWAYEPETRPHFDEIYTIVDALSNRD